MIRFLRWLFGYVKFEFYGGFAEGFINTCFEYGIGIFDIKRNKEGLIACCPAKKYKMLRKAARINGGTLKIIKKAGIVFKLVKFKGRWGLLMGATVFVIIINFLSGFVWDIQIVGNEKISSSEILSLLDENDFRPGAYWDNVNKPSIEAMLMASLDDCAWVSVNQKGSTAIVEINEARPKPDVVESKITNLRAKKDGIIVKAVTYEGWQAVKPGEAVTKGDLLISGIYEGETTKVTLFAHARGEVIAQVKEPINISVSRTQKKKAYTSEKEYKSICFFGIKIPLYIGKPATVKADTENEYSYIKLNGKQLPIGILTATVKNYEINEITLNDRELTQLAKEETDKCIKNQLSDGELIKDSTTVTLNEGNAVVAGNLIFLENIGEETEISVKKGKSSAQKNNNNG